MLLDYLAHSSVYHHIIYAPHVPTQRTIYSARHLKMSRHPPSLMRVVAGGNERNKMKPTHTEPKTEPNWTTSVGEKLLSLVHTDSSIWLNTCFPWDLSPLLAHKNEQNENSNHPTHLAVKRKNKPCDNVHTYNTSNVLLLKCLLAYLLTYVHVWHHA